MEEVERSQEEEKRDVKTRKEGRVEKEEEEEGGKEGGGGEGGRREEEKGTT